MRALEYTMIISLLLAVPATETMAQNAKRAKGQFSQRSAKIKEKFQKRQTGNETVSAERKQAIKEKIAARRQNRDENKAISKERRQAIKEKLETLCQNSENTQALRERIRAFQEAKKAQDKDLIKQQKRELQEQWKAMSPEERQALGQQIPELVHRFNSMEKNDKTKTLEGTITKEGKSWKQEAVITGEGGKQLDLTGETTATNGQASFKRELTGPKGKKTLVSGTHVKEGDTVTTDKVYTGESGKELHLSGSSTKEGNIITTTVTSDSGKTATHQVTGTIEETGLHTQSSLTTAQGQVIETSSDWMVDFLNDLEE